MNTLEEVRSQFQLRFANSDWKDLPLRAKSLNEIVSEVRGLPYNRKRIKALYEIHNMILEYHCGYVFDPTLKTQETNSKSDVYDIKDEDYEVLSTHDDVLKVKYSFTIRYKDPMAAECKPGGVRSVRPPRRVEEILTIMPGN